MLPSIKAAGFTLIELIIGIGMMSALSLVSISMLFDVVTVRNKQYSLENSSVHLRLLIDDITRSVQAAENFEVASQGLEIIGSPCVSFNYDAATYSLVKALDSSAGCAAPVSGFIAIHPDELSITNFEVLPLGHSPTLVRLRIEGDYRDNLGSHPFSYQTTINFRKDL